MVLVGGADDMGHEPLRILDDLLCRWVVPLLDRHGACVVDGGTDSGVMRSIGRARTTCHGRFPIIGVTPVGAIAGGHTPEARGIALEPNHTHALLVPGSTWGDETPWLADVAGAIAARHGSVTLVAGGGGITYTDITASIARNRPVLILAGTGRAANSVADARMGLDADPRAHDIAASALTEIVEVSDTTAVVHALDAALRQPGTSRIGHPPQVSS